MKSYVGQGMMQTKEFPHLQMILEFVFLRSMSQLRLNLAHGLLMRKHVAVTTRIPP